MNSAKSKNIGTLFSNSFIYAVSNLLQRGLGFILLPLYTFYFSKSEFGAMDQIYNMVSILALVTSLGLPHGLKRGFYLDNPTEEERKNLLGALLTLLIPITIVIAIIMWICADFLTKTLFQGEGEAIWIKLAVLFYLTLSLQQFPMQLLRTNQEAKKIAVWSLTTSVVIAGGNVYLIAVEHLGLTGMIIGNIAGYGLTSIALGFKMRKNVHLNFQFSRLSPLFAFGLPMLPALFSRKILEVSDRYIIPIYHNLEELGLYVMAAKISLILEVTILTPFLYAWQPFFYSNSTNAEAPKLFASATHYIFMLLALVFLLIDILNPWLLSILGHDKFSAAGPVVTWLILSIVFNGVQYCVSAGIHLRKKLVQELLIMVVAACLNILLNILLIPPYKGTGAAIATALSYFFYLAGTFVLAQKNYPVSYNWKRMGNVLIQTIIAFSILKLFDEVIIKCAIILIYIFTCNYADLTHHGELDWLLNKIKKKKYRKNDR